MPIRTRQRRINQTIAGWLLIWSKRMEVLEPSELRAELAQTAAHLLERYQQLALAVYVLAYPLFASGSDISMSA